MSLRAILKDLDLTVGTTNNGELVDIEYSFDDMKPSVIYDFKVNKYGHKCFEFTPLQLQEVRSLVDDYLRSNRLEKYAGKFEVVMFDGEENDKGNKKTD